MSRTNDYGPSDDDPREGNSPSVERSAEISSRIGISREAAHAEMARFRGVAEYEVRKLFGQRSALPQPAAPEMDDGAGKKKKGAAQQRPFRPLQDATADTATELHDTAPRPAEDTTPQQTELFASGPADND